MEAQPEQPAEEIERLERRISDLSRVAGELDQRLAQRTSELTAAKEELRKEAAKRRRAEEALRDTERESRLILDNIPGLVGLLSATGYVEVVNRQLLDYFGQTLEELRHWGTNGTVHPEDVPHVAEVFTRSIEAGTPYNIVQRFRRSDGVYRWFENKGFPLRDAAGGVTRWCVLLTDIDERKRVEDALRESELESRLIVDSIPGLIALFSPGGELEFVNRQIVEYFGRTLEELRRWGTDDTTHPEDKTRVVEHFARAMAAGEPFEVESRARRFDGVYRWHQSRGYPLRGTDGQIVRWYNLIIDVDERKRAEEALAVSERNLKLIIDTIPVMAWSARPDGSADFFNQHYLNYVGLSAEQAGGWGWTAALHPEDSDDLAATWQRIMASEAPGEAEARLRRHDGEYRWFLFRANPLRDESGNVVSWHGTNTDIDDRKRAEAQRDRTIEEQRAQQELLDLAQKSARAMAFDWHIQQEINVWSPEQEALYGLPPGSFDGTYQGWKKLIYAPDWPVLLKAIGHAHETGEVAVEFRVRWPDGSIHWLATNGRMFFDDEGKPYRMVGFTSDVTPRKLAEEELRRSEALLAEARSELAHVSRVATLGALTASIAHEVNQPLAGIITNASTCLRMLAADPPNVEGASETVRRTIRDGHRASDVIRRLRALFGKKGAATELVDLNEATREVIALSQSELRKGRVILHDELAGDLPPVAGDRVQLQQVIMNLLLNASEAMSGVDDRPRQVVVRTERDEAERVRLSVRDAGVGFDPQDAERLFDAFYTTKTGGMGIGLSVSRSIIESHHGRLWAAPNDGPGVTFSFSIPRAHEAAPGASGDGSIPTPAAAAAEAERVEEGS